MNYLLTSAAVLFVASVAWPAHASPACCSPMGENAPRDEAAQPTAEADMDTEVEADADAGNESTAAEQWLARIEAQTDEIDTMRAQVRYQRIQTLLGDEQTRFGRLTYDAGPPARFHIHFDRLATHGQLQQQNRRFIFDGRFLAERHDDQRLFIIRELVPEGEEGEDLLRLGEGPFALPLDLKKDTVLERFTVEQVEEDKPELENTVLLRLTPRPGVELQQTRIDMWYDRDSLLPVQVRTVNEEDQTESIIRLREIETDVDVDEAVFDVTPPREAGWQVERRGLE